MAQTLDNLAEAQCKTQETVRQLVESQARLEQGQPEIQTLKSYGIHLIQSHEW